MGASSFTNILKLNVNDTAYNMNPTNLKAMSTNKNVLGEDGSTIISSKSVPTNIDVIDNKFITGRKYRNSGSHQNLAHNQSYFQQTQRKPRFSIAVSPKDPNFHSNINLNVPGVD